jgi:hypothetical protein
MHHDRFTLILSPGYGISMLKPGFVVVMEDSWPSDLFQALLPRRRNRPLDNTYASLQSPWNRL